MQACADPTFGLPQQILNLVRFLGTIEPLFADFDGDRYVFDVETEVHDGKALLRMFHPDWKHRCLHFQMSEEYEKQNIFVETWVGPHPVEENQMSVRDMRPDHSFDFGDFGAVANYILGTGDNFYQQIRQDEEEAAKMVAAAMDQPELQVMQGGKA